jgi:protein-S-isoprenylcysteine O-methyltransferase Ste14
VTGIRMLRSVASIAAGLGFLTSSRIVAASVHLPFAAVAIGTIGAVIAGWLTARVALFAPYAHAAVLAAIVAVLSILSASAGAAPSQPVSNTVAASVITVAGVLLGGRLRAAAAGPW